MFFVKQRCFAVVYGMRTSPREYLVVEGHVDIFELSERLRRNEQRPLAEAMLPRFMQGGVDLIILPVGGDAVHHRDGSERPLEGSLDGIDLFLREVSAVGDHAEIVLAKKDLPVEPRSDRVSFLLELEGGRPFQEDYSSGKSMERKLSLLRCFFRLGIRSVQLTHNGRNELGDSFSERGGGGGLSRFGVEAVKEMNRLGILVGVSHLSEAGFFDALEVSEKPIVATHSNAGSVYDHPRNLTDRQLEALGRNGGVAGMHFLGMMLEKPTVEHFLDHVERVFHVTGSSDHVGIGIHGFDPEFNRLLPHGRGSNPPDSPQGVDNAAHLGRFIDGLLSRGYGEKEVEGFSGE